MKRLFAAAAVAVALSLVPAGTVTAGHDRPHPGNAVPPQGVPHCNDVQKTMQHGGVQADPNANLHADDDSVHFDC